MEVLYKLWTGEMCRQQVYLYCIIVSWMSGDVLSGVATDYKYMWRSRRKCIIRESRAWTRQMCACNVNTIHSLICAFSTYLSNAIWFAISIHQRCCTIFILKFWMYDISLVVIAQYICEPVYTSYTWFSAERFKRTSGIRRSSRHTPVSHDS